jgi:hypothetical protein
MAERFKAAVLKTAVDASPPWVRIPLLPLLVCLPVFAVIIFQSKYQGIDGLAVYSRL